MSTAHGAIPSRYTEIRSSLESSWTCSPCSNPTGTTLTNGFLGTESSRSRNTQANMVRLYDFRQVRKQAVWRIKYSQMFRTLSMTFGRPCMLPNSIAKLDLPFSQSLERLTMLGGSSSTSTLGPPDTVCFFTATMYVRIGYNATVSC
jgi:hypothetical protein